MNKKTAKGASENYFENTERDKNTDFTEVLNLKETIGQMNEEIEKNPSDTMMEYNKKIALMMEYRKQYFIKDLDETFSESYIELNVSVLLISFTI